ncbi:MAG: hypothetical protein R2788_11060 [Saprospiraceae bacterium]
MKSIDERTRVLGGAIIGNCAIGVVEVSAPAAMVKLPLMTSAAIGKSSIDIYNSPSASTFPKL